jgi:hypothetical protein
MFANRIALIGGAFGLLASLNSFLIAYDEGKRRRSSGLDLWLKPVYKAAVTRFGVSSDRYPIAVGRTGTALWRAYD